ncbi:unnamed protein product [Closterium sp. NIES-54]
MVDRLPTLHRGAAPALQKGDLPTQQVDGVPMLRQSGCPALPRRRQQCARSQMRTDDWPDLHRCAFVGCCLHLTSHIDFRIPTQSRLCHRDLDDVCVPPQNSPSRLPGRPGQPQVLRSTNSSRLAAEAMAEFSGTHFLFKKKPTRRPAFRVDADGWYSRIPPEPPEPPRPPAPPAPPAPPSPPAPPAPPVPPAPPAPGPVSAQVTGNQPVLTLLLPSAFDEYLSEPESNKAPDEYVKVEHFPGGRWGQPDDCPWDESAVGADDDVADLRKRAALTVPRVARGLPPGAAPLTMHKLTDHKRQAYTAAEKLKWVALMDLAVSVRALARESGIHRKCLTNWKRAAEFLKDVHSSRKRMHGRGRASWYRPMELKVYEKLLEWRRKGTAVSVGRLQEWSREFMKLLYPDKKWKGSQRWSERFRWRWNLSCKSFWQFVRAKRRERGIDTVWIINADQTPLWLEMPATTTVEETGVRSVPIRSAGYQKQRVTVMLACTADGRKLKPWVFFKRKTLPKGDFPADVVVACHENGWMDSQGVVRWLEEGVKSFLKPRFGRHAKSSMLPLDVCINKSFKASVRQQYQRWFEAEGQEQLTAAGMA